MREPSQPPPRAARWIAVRLLSEHDREFLLADLDDAFAERRARGQRALGWYLAQVAHALVTRRLTRRLGTSAPSPSSGGPMFSALWSDVVAGARGFRKQPGAIATVVLSLALGIGATTAMFTVVRAVLLAPLPYGHPEGIVTIWSKWTGYEKTWLADGEVLEYRRLSRTMKAIAAWDVARVTLTGAGDAVLVGSSPVTANLFDVFGVRPILGRTFTEDEARAAGGETPTLVVLSYGLWQRHFGGDPAVTSQHLDIDGHPARIIGVMPRGFQLPTDYGENAALPGELWTPLYFDPAKADSGNHNYYGAARLAPGATAQQASDELGAIAAARAKEGLYPPQMHFTAFALPVAQDVLGGVRPALVTLFAAVGFLMLIACTNAAALLVARAEARQREFATRTALGAGRWRLARQQLVEGFMLSIASGLLGLLLALGAKRVLEALGPTAIPRAGDVTVGWIVGAFMIALSALAAVVCSLPPAFRAFRVGLVDGLKDGSAQASASGRRLRLRSVLVATQLALAVLLLVGTGLTLRSLWSLQRIDLGFRPDGVLTARVALPNRPYDSPARIADYYDRLLARVRTVPGVASAGVIRSLPIGSSIGDWGLVVDGYTGPALQFQGVAIVPGDWQVATDGALEALGERLVRGRLFTAADRVDALPVALVNETMAGKYWPQQDALGRRFRMGGNPQSPWITVVGIVGDIRHNGITAPIKAKFYRPYAQFSQATGYIPRGGTLVVRATGDPLALADPIKNAAREVDPNVPLTATRSMQDVIDTALTSPRLASTVFVAFGGVAVVLSAIGIYGLLVFSVSQRTQEIGIRVAIGAQRGQIVGMVFRQGVRLAAIGVAAGVLFAAFWTRTLASLLYGVPPLDPVTFAVVPGVLFVIALAASVIPARRAATVAPITALRGGS